MKKIVFLAVLLKISFAFAQTAEEYNAEAVKLAYQRKYDEAITLFNKSVELDPQNLKVISNRGRCYAFWNKYSEARLDADAIINSGTDDDYLLSTAYGTHAMVFSDEKNYKRAIEYYNKTISLCPYDPENWKARGCCYAELGEYEKGEADETKAIELYALIPHGDIEQMYLNRAAMRREMGKYRGAIEDCKKCLEFNPNNHAYFLNIAVCHEDLFEYDLAVEAARKAVALSPTQRSHMILGRMLVACGENEAALEALNEVLKINRRAKLSLENDSAYYFMAVAYQNLGKLSKAKSCIKKALKLAPDDERIKEGYDILFLKGK